MYNIAIGLEETERMEILIVIGWGDKVMTQAEVRELFNSKYPNRESVSESKISKTERKFRKTDYVKHLLKSGVKSKNDFDRKVEFCDIMKERTEFKKM